MPWGAQCGTDVVIIGTAANSLGPVLFNEVDEVFEFELTEEGARHAWNLRVRRAEALSSTDLWGEVGGGEP